MSEPDSQGLDGALEALLLVAGGPVSISALAKATESSRADVGQALGVLSARLLHGIRLQRHGEDVQLVTAPEHAQAVQRLVGAERPRPLSKAALETLSAVAYRQPITRAEIEEIRGVNSDRVLETLVIRELVEELGPRPTLGRPMQYGTSLAFLQYFGLSSLDELPPVDAREERTVDSSILGFRQAPLHDAGGGEAEAGNNRGDRIG